MKHIHTLLMTALVSTSALAAAPVEPGTPVPEAHRTLLGISVMPLFLGNGVPEVEGERVVSPRLSVGLGLRAGLIRSESRAESSEGDNLSGNFDQSGYALRAEPMARVFLTGTAPEGLWVSPRLAVSRDWAKSEDGATGFLSTTDSGLWSVSGSALLGYSTIVGRGLAIQFGAGFEAAYSRHTLKLRMPTLGAEGEFVERESRSRSWSVRERLALSVGWAF